MAIRFVSKAESTISKRSNRERTPATNSDFQQAVRDSRTEEIDLGVNTVKLLDKILKTAADTISDRLLKKYGKGSLTERYLGAMLGDVDDALKIFKIDYHNILNVAMLASAQIVVGRELNFLDLALTYLTKNILDDLRMSITRSILVGGVGQVSVSFGRVAENAVSAVFTRTHLDGLTLSDRLWRLDEGIRQKLRDQVIQSIAQQDSARDLAKQVRQYLTERGQGNARYNSMRLARTEINTAHREGHIRAITDEAGNLRDYVYAIGWRLSMSHPRYDICDEWASDDSDGLGPGNYVPERVPIDHPNGLCFTVTILKDHQDLQFVAKEPIPKPEGVQ